MTKPGKIEIRSEEVQEILGTTPSWLVSWGTTMAFLTLVILGWVGYFIRYPETLVSNIKVSSTDPPKKLVAPSSDQIFQILVENEDTVKAGQTLMAFMSRATFEDVLTLEDHVVLMEGLSDSFLLSFSPPRNLLLGELQEDFYEFMQKQESFRSKLSNTYQDYSISQLNRKIKKERAVITSEKERKKTLEKELSLVQRRFTREENLYKSNLFNLDELRKTEEEVITLQRLIQGIESTVKNKQFDIELARSEISGMEGGNAYSKVIAASDLRESFLQLQDKIEAWKEKNLILAPIDGIVLFEKEKVSERQYVSAETPIGVVVPLEKKETVGRMYLNSMGTGKIKVGQEVIVKFDSYPFEEFGAVKGVVFSKGTILHEEKIPVEISFPNGLMTNSGFSIKLDQEMTGTAEIILNKKRFIEKVFEKIRTLRG